MSESIHPEDAVAYPATRKKRRPLLTVGVLALLGCGLAWSVHTAQLAFSTEKTDDAYITGRVHRIAAGVEGPLLEVVADDNEEVKSGQVLARIDPKEYEILEKQAIAALEQAKAGELQAQAAASEARASSRQADANISMAEAEVLQGRSKLDLAQSTDQRNDKLLRGSMHAISQAESDVSRSDVAAAEAIVAAGEAKLAAAQAGKEAAQSSIQSAEARVVSAQADIAAGKAAIEEARRKIELTTVTAPAAGRVGNKNAESGNRVQKGQPLYALVEEDYWIVGNFKETQLKNMKEGQAVDIAVDALGGKHFKGTIDGLAPATGAQFALLPPDNATGNFTKVVQRVPVKITFDRESIRGSEALLRAGLSAVVRVSVN
ncbi:HlyD family secretion protein [Luteolibacter soli]|uniref:HlyD family secretion protein n=1 Tax=Luteolibacter soli TaxID=3135280 RepID=A0ABU9AZ87_9BACT